MSVNLEPVVYMESNSINLMRVISLYLMVNIHVAVRGAYVLHDYWWIANLWDSVSRICVPLFFMLSGALLVDKQEGLGVFFRKRAAKILAPFITWSLIYLLYRLYVGNEKDLAIESILAGPTYFHLWFMYAIVGLYIAMPLLRVYYSSASMSLNVYVLLCWFVGLSIMPMLQSFGLFPNFAIPVNFLPQYAGYMLLGVLLRDIAQKRFALVSMCLFVFFSLLTFWLTEFVSERSGALNERFYDYLAPNVILMSVFAFVVLNWVGSRINRGSVFLSELGVCSFGAYLAHMLIMQTLLMYGGEVIPAWNTPYIAISIPLLTIVTFFLSLLLIWVLRKNKVTRILFT